MADDLADVIETLRARRAEHVSSIELLDQAIANLTMLVSGPVPTTATTTVTVPTVGTAPIVTTWTPPGSTKSVLQSALDLANEAPKDWSADEIIKEYENRGTPLEVKDPRNAMFSALSRATKKGDLVRVGHGRYIARKWMPDGIVARGFESDGGMQPIFDLGENAATPEEAPSD